MPSFLGHDTRDKSPTAHFLTAMPLTPQPNPPLLPRELHLWRVDLDHPSAALDILAECLSADERRRAERFVREADRRRFIVSHSALRMILGRRLGIPPGDVKMTNRAGGKPKLAASLQASSLRFNLSHCDTMAMIALALDREVGVDLEHVRPLHEMESIVGRYFAPGERAAWLALPDRERSAAFFRCWTRKEAYLKARGLGLSAGLDRFEVSLAPDEPACLLNVADLQVSAAQWHMYDVSPGGDFTAACVVEGGIDEISVYDWPQPLTPRGAT